MRFVVEVVPAGAGGVEGTVQGEGPGEPTPFCGWLALLRLLEPGGGTEETRTSRATHKPGLKTGALG